MRVAVAMGVRVLVSMVVVMSVSVGGFVPPSTAQFAQASDQQPAADGDDKDTRANPEHRVQPLWCDCR
jgi:hypothetical protein